MKDISSIIKAYETKGRALIGTVLSPSANFTEVSAAFQGLLPEPARALEELCKFYEAEMIRCRDGGAYFSGCLAGAAMIESFLLLFCFLEKNTVIASAKFPRSSRENKPYEEVASHWTLKELIPIAEELKWIGPEVVERDLVTALVDGYKEMLPTAIPNLSEEELNSVLQSLERHPDTALLVLMQSMRNLVHGGRCVRLRRRLWSEDFSDWAKLVMVLTVEVRDCLILRLGKAYEQYVRALAESPEGLVRIATLMSQFGIKREATNQ